MIVFSSQNTVFISFQNGLGNEELIAELMGEDRVLGGLTAQGANIEVTMSLSSSSLSPDHLVRVRATSEPTLP